jgi:hypothetical protein
MYLYRKHREEWESSLQRFKNPTLNGGSLFADESRAALDDNVDGGSNDDSGSDDDGDDASDCEAALDGAFEVASAGKTSYNNSNKRKLTEAVDGGIKRTNKSMFGESINSGKTMKSVSDVDKTKGKFSGQQYAKKAKK